VIDFEPYGKNNLVIEFQGPLLWAKSSGDASIYYSEVSKQHGVYLWTVPTPNGYLVYYVGETGVNFRTRMRDHYKEQLSGMYHIYDPEQFCLGRKCELWRGIYGKGGIRDHNKFLEILPEIAPVLVRFINIFHFYVAPMQCDRRIRERLEAALANHLYEQPGVIGAFQEKNIRYNLRRSNEDPIKVKIACPQVVQGIPTELNI
jgi:hypothetical protein